VDLVGAVSQGVVSYGAKITLDAGDSRITSGMTVNADITTASAQSVVIVPSSAITTLNGKSYVRTVPSAASATPSLTRSYTGSSTPGFAAFAAQRTRTVASTSVTPQRVEVTTGITDGTNTQILTGSHGRRDDSRAYADHCREDDCRSRDYPHDRDKERRALETPPSAVPRASADSL